MCLLVQGEWERAATVLGEALSICLKDEVETMYLPIASHLSIALIETGNAEGARELLRSAVAKEATAAGHYAIDYLSIALSEVQRRSGDFAAALATAEQAVKETSAYGEAAFNVRALLQQAAALGTFEHRSSEAEQVYRYALTAAERLGMRPWQALVHEGLEHLFTARGKHELAAQARLAARQLWQALDAPARLARFEGQLEH
jgi:tetratricopeptide (TPR) repeat protein